MTDQQKETIIRLKDSLEMHTIKRDFLLYACFFGVFCLLPALGGDTPGVSVLMGLMLLPFLGFYVWRTIEIFRKQEHYIFCQCQLNQPHSSFWLGTMYFTILIEMPDGTTRPADTHAIFAARGIAEPRMEDYVNSTVTIAYNPETEMVVVIG